MEKVRQLLGEVYLMFGLFLALDKVTSTFSFSKDDLSRDGSIVHGKARRLRSVPWNHSSAGSRNKYPVLEEIPTVSFGRTFEALDGF